MQPLTEMSTRNILVVKWRPTSEADNLSSIFEPIVKKMRDPRRRTTLLASTACYMDSFTVTFTGIPETRKHIVSENGFVSALS
jgi:hypothetical protein